jgi:ADP-ribose pyrophosphatase YjhB (NUDIX family)
MYIIRIYALIINPRKEILLSSETYQGKNFVKFPGGGLEHGEGTREGLVREIQEEMGLEAEIGDHFYTTDFYLQSAFNPNDQVLSIYYLVHLPEWEKVKSEVWPPRFDGRKERFHWVELEKLSANMLNFPADKKVVSMLLSNTKA